MVNNMTTQNYLMIQENIVTNVCLWDGNTQTWQPPAEATMLVAETTQTKVWKLDTELKNYVLIDSVGDAGIGFTWDGSFCITAEPKPEKLTPASDQPETTGTVTL
jgi:hypothetical protein